MTTLYIFVSILLVSLASLAGVLLFSLRDKLLKKLLMYFVSFATGALFANVFFHLLPELAEESEDIHFSFSLILVGILISFVLEKFIHWHHCHNLDCKHAEPVGVMMLVGDALHNVTDGILIATTFMVDTSVGIATTIAVILHEIPQEIGDFAVLIHSGFSKGKALMWNFISALTAFAGMAVVLVLSGSVEHVEMLLLPLAIGNFLYIAGSDLIPTLHKESRLKPAFLQLTAMLAGIILLYGLLGDSHAHKHEENDDHGHEIHDEQTGSFDSV